MRTSGGRLQGDCGKRNRKDGMTMKKTLGKRLVSGVTSGLLAVMYTGNASRYPSLGLRLTMYNIHEPLNWK